MNIVLSIHPEHAAKIYAGEKKIEFRTTIPRKYNLYEGVAPWDDYIFLYETAPVFAVTGYIKVDSYININRVFRDNNLDRMRDIIKNGCMSFEQIIKYKPNLQLWGWHIKEFYNWGRNEYITRFSPSEKPPQSWCYTKADLQSQICLKFDHPLNKKSCERERVIFLKWKKYDLKKLTLKGG